MCNYREADGPQANFFMVRGSVARAAVGGGLLEGVTRVHLRARRELGIGPRRSAAPGGSASADEVFSSTPRAEPGREARRPRRRSGKPGPVTKTAGPLPAAGAETHAYATIGGHAQIRFRSHTGCRSARPTATPCSRTHGSRWAACSRDKDATGVGGDGVGGVRRVLQHVVLRVSVTVQHRWISFPDRDQASQKRSAPFRLALRSARSSSSPRPGTRQSVREAVVHPTLGHVLLVDGRDGRRGPRRVLNGRRSTRATAVVVGVEDVVVRLRPRRVVGVGDRDPGRVSHAVGPGMRT